ncbi:CotH kinase family protein [Clostridiaceae bacterium M8S5]|nr:CotH kinase family protein [Clostridiaceae bacterium M8S5]
MKKVLRIATFFGCVLLIATCFLFAIIEKKDVDLSKYNVENIDLTLSMKDIEVMNTYKTSATSNNKKRKVIMNIEDISYEATIDKLDENLPLDSEEISFELSIEDDNAFIKQDKLRVLAYDKLAIDKSMKIMYLADNMKLLNAGANVCKVSINNVDKGYYLLTDKYSSDFLKSNNITNGAVIKISRKKGKYDIDFIATTSKHKDLENQCQKLFSEIVTTQLIDESTTKNIATIGYLIGGINTSNMYFALDVDRKTLSPIIDSQMVYEKASNLIDIDKYDQEALRQNAINLGINIDDMYNQKVDIKKVEDNMYLTELYISGEKALINEKEGLIFVSLPRGVDTINTISYKAKDNKRLYIQDSSNQRVLLENNKSYDFKEYIYRGKLFIENVAREYDIFITTGDVDIMHVDLGEEIDPKEKKPCDIMYLSRKEAHRLSAGIELYNDNKQPKKNYSIKLKKDNKIETLGDFREIILDGIDKDSSLIKKKLMYDIMNSVGNSKLKARFIEVIIDGDYKGLYVLSPKIDEDFLNLDDFNRDYNFNNALLYKAMDINADFKSTNTILDLHKNKYEDFPKQRQPKQKADDPILGYHSGYEQKHPKINEFGERYSQIESLVKFIATASDKEFINNIFSMIDKESYIRNCAILQVLGVNNLSVQDQYVYREKGKATTFKFIPNDSNSVFGMINQSYVDYDTLMSNSLYNRCMNSPQFNKEVWSKIKEITNKLITENYISNKTKQYKKEIAPAQSRNYWAWCRKYKSLNNINLYSREIQSINILMNKRLSWLKAESDKY